MMTKYYSLLLALVVMPLFISAQQSDAINATNAFRLADSTMNFLPIYKANRELSYTSPKGELGSPVKFVLIGKLTTSYFLFAPEKSRFAFALIPELPSK